jgi:Bacterial virulence factor lipase N-terminal
MKRALLSALMILTLAWSAWAVADRPVHPRFDLASSVNGSPFPSDLYTVADASNRTGRRVNMPLPDRSTHPSDYDDLTVINTLDGFNLLPRVSIPFDGSIDPSSVSSATVYLVELAQVGKDTIVANTVGINQIVWDPATLTLHVESNDLLREGARYAVIVTGGILDTSGQRVKASPEFKQFIDDDDSTLPAELEEYRAKALAALKALKAVGVHRGDVAVASVFTVETATSALEAVRDHLKSSPPPATVNFAIGPGGSRAVFARSSLQTITFRQHTGTDMFNNVAVPLSVLDVMSPGSVGTIAWGTFVSPQFIGTDAVMSSRGTLDAMPKQFGDATLELVLFLPSGTKPASGWPVVFLGHGGTTSIHAAPVWNLTGSLAARGFAVIGINAVGRGFGPLGTLIIKKTDGTTVEINAGGRAFDQNGDGLIANVLSQEGAAATAPNTIIGQRDAVRQTAIDYMQLVRVIQAGIDVDGDGSVELDTSNMVFLGNSFATGYETCFLAVEPDVRVAVIGSPGALPGRPDLLTKRPSGRTQVGAWLADRTPSLLNDAYGLTTWGGIPVTAPFYNENMPLRDVPPVTNTIPGAMAIQEHFDRIEWVQASNDFATQGRHLVVEPLPGVPPKTILVLFAKGDLTAPNPRSSALVRFGQLRERTIYYRNDLAFAEDPTVPKDPHTFLQPIAGTGIAAQVARGGQTTIADFFVSGGTTINQPLPARYFEFPIDVLPEDYSFIP